MHDTPKRSAELPLLYRRDIDGRGQHSRIVVAACRSLTTAAILLLGVIAGMVGGCSEAPEPKGLQHQLGNHKQAREGAIHHLAARPVYEHATGEDTCESAHADRLSFSDAVARIVELDGRIRSACNRGELEEVESLLQEIEQRLKGLPKLAESPTTGVDEKAVGIISARLVDAFARLGEMVRGGEVSTAVNVAPTIARDIGPFRAFLAVHRP